MLYVQLQVVTQSLIDIIVYFIMMYFIMNNNIDMSSLKYVFKFHDYGCV